ncbi:MAG: hypothetical protein AAGH57_13270, partial [Pseudomonadota bacterium]
MGKVAFQTLLALSLVATSFAAEAGVSRSKKGYFNDKAQCNSIAQNGGWTTFMTLFENDPGVFSDLKSKTKAKSRRRYESRMVIAFDPRFAERAPTKEQLFSTTKKGRYLGSWLQPHGAVSADYAPRGGSGFTHPHGVLAVGNQPLPDFWFGHYSLRKRRRGSNRLSEQLTFLLPSGTHKAFEAQAPIVFSEPHRYVEASALDSGVNVQFELVDVTQRVFDLKGYTPLVLQSPKEAPMHLLPVMRQVSDDAWRREAWVSTGRIAVTGMWNVNRQGKKFLDLMNDAQNRLNQHVRKSTQGQEKTGFLGVR